MAGMTVSNALSRPGWVVVAEYENLPGCPRPWAAVCG
jgi:hypothetical protein